MEPARPTTSVRRVMTVLAAAAALVAAAAAPAQAEGHGSSGSPRRVASGLDNPRQLAFGPGGTLYIAEAGTGGAGPCVPGPEGEDVCFGTSGAVTAVNEHGRQWRPVSGLPSLAAAGGFAAIGPSDVVKPAEGRLAVLIGLGADPAVRDSLPEAGQTMGTLQLAVMGTSRMRTIADLAAHEAAANPIHDPDSNPSSLIKVGSRYVVTDAGGNTLVTVPSSGAPRTTAVFQDQMADAPPFLGLPPGTQIPAQAVPTAVVQGPDGAYYVSQLTGFPFEPDSANIYRVRPGHAPTVWASGLTNVTSLAFDSRGRLYAVQLANDGLLNVPPGELPTGSLVKVSRSGDHTVVAGDLKAPYGVAIRGGAAYVSTCAICPDGGEVWKMHLR